jgi:ribonuclease J
MLLALTKPKYFMPVHGEYPMQKAHIELAVETGVDPNNCYLMENGQVLTLRHTENRVFFNSEVKAGPVCIDQSGEVIDEVVRKERKVMADEGTVIIIFNLNETDKLIDVDVYTKSFLRIRNYGFMLNTSREKSIEHYMREVDGKNFYLKDTIPGLRLEIEEITKKFINKKPLVVTWMARRNDKKNQTSV